jgi:hypothetical protein
VSSTLAIAKQIGNVQSFQAGLIAQLTYARAINHIAARQMLGNIETRFARQNQSANSSKNIGIAEASGS